MTSAYEKQRNKNIASNQRKLDALGLLYGSNLLAPFEKVIQTSFARNSKRNVSERDDNDYRLDECDGLFSSSSNDDDNNVPSNPQMKKSFTVVPLVNHHVLFPHMKGPLLRGPITFN